MFALFCLFARMSRKTIFVLCPKQEGSKSSLGFEVFFLFFLSLSLGVQIS